MTTTSNTAGKTKKAAAPAAVKATLPKEAKPKAPAKAATARKRRPPGVAPEQRRQYVEVAAYYIAERRGFQGGCEMDDWTQAEVEIDRLLAEDKLSG